MFLVFGGMTSNFICLTFSILRSSFLWRIATIFLSLDKKMVRSHLGYVTQVWTYGDRLMNLNLLPISYWHEFLDMIFFFKVVTGTFRVSPSVIPQVLVTRTTRSNSNRNVTHFISRKCNTVTFQRSFFNRSTRIWNMLANDLQLSCNLQISQFKSIMCKYYVDALERNYDPENPRS